MTNKIAHVGTALDKTVRSYLIDANQRTIIMASDVPAHVADVKALIYQIESNDLGRYSVWQTVFFTSATQRGLHCCQTQLRALAHGYSGFTDYAVAVEYCRSIVSSGKFEKETGYIPDVVEVCGMATMLYPSSALEAEDIIRAKFEAHIQASIFSANLSGSVHLSRNKYKPEQYHRQDIHAMWLAFKSGYLLARQEDEGAK